MEIDLSDNIQDQDDNNGVDSSGIDGFSFSQVFKHDGRNVQWSPDGLYIASILEKKLIVRERTELTVVYSHDLEDKLDYFEWSSDSSLILCLYKKYDVVDVYSLLDPKYMIRIAAHEEGMVGATFAHDSTHVIVFSDFQLRTTVYSLNPKEGYNPRSMICYTDNDSFLILGSRNGGKDMINIISTTTWTIINQFQVDSIDMESISFCKDDKCICIIDSPLYYNVFIYTLNGTKITQINPYNDAMGCRRFAFSPSQPLLALGGYDQCIRVYNTISWKDQSIHIHTQESFVDNAAAYIEISKSDVYQSLQGQKATPKLENELKAAAGDTFFYVYRGAIDIALKKIQPRIEECKVGISNLSWSPDGRYVQSTSDNLPKAVWIWDIYRHRLHSIIIFKEVVTSVTWCPVAFLLAIATASKMVYIWRPTGMCWLRIPEKDFNVKTLKWNDDGNTLLLCDQNSYIVSYFE
ncbi:hypothetical protein WA158_005764 [Blastocystis sp. Blastoise]